MSNILSAIKLLLVESLKYLKVINENKNLTLCWIPGDKDIIDNEVDDKLAKIVMNLTAEPEILSSLFGVNEILTQY